MREIVLRGITWEHRRAIDPLIAALPGFREEHPDITVEWSSRPLAGFEFQPVDELAAAYDLIVLDHPFAGEIARLDCLAPLDDLIGHEQESAFIGPTLESYRYAGRLWAAPLDAACQISVRRPDLLSRLGETPPQSWSEMLALGARLAPHGLRLAIAFAGVHGLMTFFSLCSNLGRPCGGDPDGPFIDLETARVALKAMRRLLDFVPAEALDWNSIAVQDAMAAREDLVFCPAVYGFAAYAENDTKHPLEFGDFAGLRTPYFAGSTLGGAGLGVSARCAAREAAFAYARYLLRGDTQCGFAKHHGQPARIEAWDDEPTNSRFGGFYRNTRASLENAWIRPRHDGYLRFQSETGDLIEQHLRGHLAEEPLLTRLEELHECTGRQAPKERPRAI